MTLYSRRGLDLFERIVYIYIYIYIYMCVCVCVCVYIYIYICVCVCVCVCIYTYVYIYIYIYIYIYWVDVRKNSHLGSFGNDFANFYDIAYVLVSGVKIYCSMWVVLSL